MCDLVVGGAGEHFGEPGHGGEVIESADFDQRVGDS